MATPWEEDDDDEGVEVSAVVVDPKKQTEDAFAPPRSKTGGGRGGRGGFNRGNFSRGNYSSNRGQFNNYREGSYGRDYRVKRDFSNATCFYCGKKGHMYPACPDLKEVVMKKAEEKGYKPPSSFPQPKEN
jgi:hypothetical protein